MLPLHQRQKKQPICMLCQQALTLKQRVWALFPTFFLLEIVTKKAHGRPNRYRRKVLTINDDRKSVQLVNIPFHCPETASFSTLCFPNNHGLICRSFGISSSTYFSMLSWQKKQKPKLWLIFTNIGCLFFFLFLFSLALVMQISILDFFQKINN